MNSFIALFIAAIILYNLIMHAQDMKYANADLKIELSDEHICVQNLFFPR